MVYLSKLRRKTAFVKLILITLVHDVKENGCAIRPRWVGISGMNAAPRNCRNQDRALCKKVMKFEAVGSTWQVIIDVSENYLAYERYPGPNFQAQTTVLLLLNGDGFGMGNLGQGVGLAWFALSIALDVVALIPHRGQ